MNKLLLNILFSFVIFIIFLSYQANSLENAKSSSPQPTPIPVVQFPDGEKLWSLIQDWRLKNGLQPYIKDQRLCEIAKDRSDDPFDNHKGFFDKYGNRPYILSENVASWVSTELQTIYGWLNSPGHLANLKNPYAYSCVICQQSTCVQIFSNFSKN